MGALDSTGTPANDAELAAFVLRMRVVYGRSAGLRFAAVTTPPCRMGGRTSGLAPRGWCRPMLLGRRGRRAGFLACSLGLAATACRGPFFTSLGALGAGV
jgi:hypothetical protein